MKSNSQAGRGIDPTHKSGKCSTANRKSKSTSGAGFGQTGKGKQVGNKAK